MKQRILFSLTVGLGSVVLAWAVAMIIWVLSLLPPMLGVTVWVFLVSFILTFVIF